MKLDTRHNLVLVALLGVVTLFFWIVGWIA